MRDAATAFPAEVNAAVQAAIAASGMPTKELSRRSGISYTTLTRRLTSGGRSPFSVAEIGAIAAALRINPMDLMLKRSAA